MSLDFLKISKSPVDLNDIQILQGNITITRKQDKSEHNENAIVDLMRALNKKVTQTPKQVIVQENKTIGVPNKMDKILTLTQMEPSEVETLLKNYENQDEEEKEKSSYAKLNTITRKPKIQKQFKRGLASIHHENMHDILKSYTHYYNNDSLFKVPLYQSYFMNDRAGFLDSLKTKLLDRLEEMNNDLAPKSCDSSSKESGFHPLYHQELVKQYLNATTPYRGLLLFHGLGSGKTCTSIGIIESMKDTKPQIFVLTPASLQQNYKTQMKFCGSELFRKTENWEYVLYPTNPEERSQFIKQVHVLTQLPMKYLEKKERKGIYLIQKGRRRDDYDRDDIDVVELEKQINLMIENRFEFISYNGIKKSRWINHYKSSGNNPFDHSTIIIDEGHNFVSRIWNKLEKGETSVSTMMYEDILCAENCNVVVLSGTPLINYPSEMGVLFNMIGGSYVILEIPCYHRDNSKNSKNALKHVLHDIIIIDYIEFHKKQSSEYGLLRVIKNPYGFIKDKDTGEVTYDFDSGSFTTEELLMMIIQTLKDNDYKVDEKKKDMIIKKKRFPETQALFNKEFIQNNTFVKKEYFQNKIIGMVSYIGDNRDLMPDVIVPRDDELTQKLYPNDELFIEEIMMNPNVLKQYAQARSIERDMDKQSRKSKSSKDKQTSSYQIFSRSACNFVFPSDIQRPYPKLKERMTEEDLESREVLEEVEDLKNIKDIRKLERIKKYEADIQNVLTRLLESPHMYFESKIPKLIQSLSLKKNAKKYNIQMGVTETNKLEYCSPKFQRILQNIMNPENIGLHMLYSNFRTLEGIGIFKMILDYYGYTEFKIRKRAMGTIIDYELDIDHPYYEDSCFSSSHYHGRKFYALYTGKENTEEKEIIRNIYNGNLDDIPPHLKKDIQEKFYGNNEPTSVNQNLYGSLIQLLIISASGSEGIDLKNVRCVHIMEPYWHPVRMEQVIGRARRICSHKELPEEEQNVKVYLYLLVHNKKLLDKNRQRFTELIETDYERDLKRAISTDERLYGIMNRKKKLMDQFLTVLKISAIDCHKNYDDKDKCLTMHASDSKQLLVGYDYETDKKERTRLKNSKSDNDNMGIGV